MKLIIATKNEGKIEGARRAFERFFEDIEIVEEAEEKTVVKVLNGKRMKDSDRTTPESIE